jgi:hypothetical protein
MAAKGNISAYMNKTRESFRSMYGASTTAGEKDISMHILAKAALTIGGLAVLGALTDHPTPQTAAQSTAATAQPAESVSYTAQELFNAYEANEVATDLRVRGKVVYMSGTVQSSDIDAFDHIHVRLRTSNQFMSANATMQPRETGKVAALHNGQSVRVRCLKMKRWVGSPWGDDCTLVD